MDEVYELPTVKFKCPQCEAISIFFVKISMFKRGQIIKCSECNTEFKMKPFT